MTARIVDVFLKDELVKSYEFEAGLLLAPLFDQDFVDRTKARMTAVSVTNQGSGYYFGPQVIFSPP